MWVTAIHNCMKNGSERITIALGLCKYQVYSFESSYNINFLVHSLVWNMNKQKIKYLWKITAEKLEVIREGDKKR
jgi:hypothetical protein